MGNEASRPNQPEDSQSGAESYEGLLAHYVDRLLDGEKVDSDAIRSAHPNHGEQILRDLESFIDPGVETEKELLGTLGDYQLRRQIGRGGMGVVYEAWQTSLDRQVALKVLPAGVAADTKSYSRFLREAQIAAKIHHPNVVAVHGFGVESNTPYFAMELVEGETLAQILARLKAAEGKEEERKDRKSTRLNSSHIQKSRMPSSA